MIHEREQVRAFLSDLVDQSMAAETQITLGGGRARITRFSDNRIAEHITERRLQIWAKLAFRSASKCRVGFSGTSDLTPEGLTRLLEVSRSVAQDRPVIDDYLEMPWAEDYESALVDTSGAFDPSTANAGPAFCAAEVADLALPCRRLGYRCDGYHALVEGALSVGGSTGISAVANCNELFQYHLSTHAEVAASISTPRGGVGVVAARAMRASELHLPTLLERAFADAELPRREGVVRAGNYRVVLGAPALGELLDLLPPHLSNHAIETGSSILSGRLGEQVFHPSIQFTVNPTHSLLLRRAFDAEGWPRREVSLVSDGVLQRGILSRVEGRRTGTTPHGYLLLDGDPGVAVPENLVLGGGEGTVDDLVAETERGVLIRRFHAPLFTDPGAMVVEGYADRDVFIVAGGRVTEALPHLRFRIDVMALLNNVVLAGTPEVAGNHVAPPLVADSLEVFS